MTSHPRLAQAVLDLVLQVLRHLGRVAAQRDVVVLVGVVGIARGEVAHGGLGLHLHVVLVVVHLEARASAVSTTFQTTTAAISIGLPSVSFTLSCALSKLRTRSEIRCFV